MALNKTKEIKYKEQYGVIVLCKNESEQIEIYERPLSFYGSMNFSQWA